MPHLPMLDCDISRYFISKIYQIEFRKSPLQYWVSLFVWIRPGLPGSSLYNDHFAHRTANEMSGDQGTPQKRSVAGETNLVNVSRGDLTDSLLSAFSLRVF